MSHDQFSENPALPSVTTPLTDLANGSWCRNPDVISRNFTGEYVLVPMKQTRVDMQRMYSLNEAGAFLWEQLQTKKTRQALIDALYTNFELSATQAQTDVTDFLTALAERGLIIQIDN